jgi:hypothetical protein
MKRLFAVFFVLPMILLGLSFNVAYAESVTLAWDAPTTNADGSVLEDLAGYRVYYGTISGNYSTNIDVGMDTTAQIILPNNGSTYYFATTAYDTSGNESGFSNEMSRRMKDEIAPSNPTGCRFLE